LVNGVFVARRAGRDHEDGPRTDVGGGRTMMLWIVGGIAGYLAALAAAMGLCKAGATTDAEFYMADARPGVRNRWPRAA
jgi:hypothetical protein